MLSSFNDFEEHVRWHVEEAARQRASLLLLPEFFTIELMTLEGYTGETNAEMELIFEQFAKTYTEPVKEVCANLASEYNLAIAAGSHFAYDSSEDRCYNTAFVFLPDGRTHVQNKIHPSYELVYNKDITTPGNKLSVFEIDSVKIGISVCYDSSFPEIARILSRLGADIILAPTACLDEWGRARNVLFSQARASENQLFVVNSHLIGALPIPKHIPYGFTFTGQSGIYSPIQPMIGTPSGIIKQGEPNVESVITAELNIDYLKSIRANGHNRNLKDMRPEFYKHYEEQFA
ncbi:nitrilase-related carbon-nitrogen hydrolase [Paenibacillus sp. GCM10023252]